jgi:hypothetical protein
MAFCLEKCIMDQTCPVVHKSRRPQAGLKTVTLFYIHCGFIAQLICKMQNNLLFRVENEELFVFPSAAKEFSSPSVNCSPAGQHNNCLLKHNVAAMIIRIFNY